MTVKEYIEKLDFRQLETKSYPVCEFDDKICFSDRDTHDCLKISRRENRSTHQADKKTHQTQWSTIVLVRSPKVEIKYSWCFDCQSVWSEYVVGYTKNDEAIQRWHIKNGKNEELGL